MDQFPDDIDLIAKWALGLFLAVEELAMLLTSESSMLTSSVERSGVQDLHSSLVSLISYLVVMIGHPENFTPIKRWSHLIKPVFDLGQRLASDYALRALKRRNQQGLANFFAWSSGISMEIPPDLALFAEKIKTLEGERSNYVWKDSGRISLGFAAPFLEECLVGVDLKRHELVRSLMGGQSRLSAICIVGAAGVGKTALANIVFHDEAVTRHFDFCSWVTVGRSRGVEDILKARLLREYRNKAKNIEAMKMDEVVKILRGKLRSKRFVFVFDDVWREDFFEALKDVLPENDNGSQIIVTTCSTSVAASFRLGDIHRLEPLSEAMSRDLLWRIAFQNVATLGCPPSLEKISEELIRICEGSPLAIVTMAGWLRRTQHSVAEWQHLLENSFNILSKSKVFQIMARSFDDLPYLLKLCFSYFTVFPKGSLIPYDKLFKLWIASGFVEEKPRTTMEETAEEYLNAMIQRNLVQACQGFYGLEKYCQVSVLMHEMAREQAVKLGFYKYIYNGNGSFIDSSIAHMYASHDTGRFGSRRFSEVRSAFYIDLSALPGSFVAKICDEFKLLRTLVFENVQIENLPNELGNLFFLKYLSLKNTKVKKLPSSIGKLKNLETLDATNTLLTELPVEINKLRNLRHLLVSRHEDNIRLYCAQGVRVKPGISKLKSLQSLTTVEEHGAFLAELGRLTQLRRLGISMLTGQASSALYAPIENMTLLLHLSLHARDDLDLRSITAPPLLLEILALKGKLLAFPAWVSSLQNLTMACLSFSGLVDDDPLVHFSRLPNLVSLWLYREFDGHRLRFEGGGFQALRLLVLRELPNLEAIEIEDGSLPILEDLRIGPSPRLDKLPSGIQSLTRLKSIALYDMPRKFVLDLQPDGGSEYNKVHRVASVQFRYRVKGRQYVWYELGELDLLDYLQGNLCQIQEQNLQLSFCYSDGDDDDKDSLSASSFQGRPSVSSGRFSFFTDDVED